MKKKYLAAILGVMIATTSVTACGAATTETTTNTTESSENKETEDTKAESEESADDSDSSADADKEDSDEEDVTYGEVKSVEDGKITIAVGTMKEMGGNGGTPGGDQGEAPSMLDLTGNEMTVTVTDDTVCRICNTFWFPSCQDELFCLLSCCSYGFYIPYMPMLFLCAQLPPPLKFFVLFSAPVSVVRRFLRISDSP